MSNKKTSVTASEKQNYELKNSVANVFLLLMFTLFPLYICIYADSIPPFLHFDNAFTSIRHDKYFLFLILTGLAVIVEFLLFATYSEKNKDEKKIENRHSLLDTFSFTDWAVIAFVISGLISTLFSQYKETAFFGEPNGRNSGLLLFLFYAAAYFAVTRFFYYMEYVFAALAGAGIVVYLLSVLNGFYIDPLGTFNVLSESQANDFISTIGNKNLLSSYICISLPITVAMSVYTKKIGLRILYLISSGFGFMSLMVSDSDSGILGFGLFTAIFLIVYSRKISGLKRYFLSLTVMLFSAKILRLFSLAMNDKYKEIGDLQQFFVFSKISYILLGFCFVITAVLYYIDNKKTDMMLPKAVPIALTALLVAFVIGALATVIYFSTVDTTTDLGEFEKLIRFNDKWGTHRGFMWIRSMWIFGDANIWQKLFGTGPDTFFYPFSPYFSELSKYGDGSTNAAHNEYINYLITIGIFGLCSYLAFVGGALVRAIKSVSKNPVALVFSAGVICYSIQAIVNISQPITTPMFIICVALCEATARHKVTTA